MLDECLLISSLPSKALRTLRESRGLPSNSTCILKAKPGKTQSWYSFYQFRSSLTLQTSDFDKIDDFDVDSTSLTMSFKKCIVIMT